MQDTRRKIQDARQKTGADRTASWWKRRLMVLMLEVGRLGSEEVVYQVRRTMYQADGVHDGEIMDRRKIW
ncbi:hypothetical protein [Mariniradius saccharolyticus]|nr:hypothetical protein [Mariniradius saccharolyticus]